MSMFGGRRGPSAAPGSIRVEPPSARTGGGDSHSRAPHFQPAPPPAPDAGTLDEARSILDDLRVHLAELDRREQSLNSQLSLLEHEQRALRLQSQKLADESRAIQQVLEEREQRVTEREAAAAELNLAADERQADLDEQLGDIERQRAQLTELVAAELAEEHSRIAARHDELDLARKELDQQRERLAADVRADFDRERQDLDDRVRHLEDREAEFERESSNFAAELARREADREQELAEHAALLAQMRAEQLAEVEAREAQVGQREVDLVKRSRFQEDHLVRLRSALEAQQAELERTRASLAVWSADVEATVRQRLSHLRKYRDLLDRREADCEAAWQALAEARRQQAAALDTLRQNVIADQQALEAHQQAVTGDLRRHADLVRLREQEVERRGARIDQLRDDLDRRQQFIAAREADLQTAVTWLTDHVGADEVATLLPHLEPAAMPEPVIDDQRREIADAERQLSQWQHELQRERETFAQMIADREQRLRAREATLGRQYEQLAAREASLQSEQLRERTEREQTFVLLETLVEQIEQRLHRA